MAPPTVSEDEAAVTAMDCSTGAVAVTVITAVVAVLPDAVWVAVMVVVPAATGVTTPEALIDTIPAVLAWNVEPAVRSCVGPVLYVPVTVSCVVAPPMTSDVDAGATVIDWRTGGGGTVTVIALLVPLIPETVAVIVVVPAATAVTTPAALTETTPAVFATYVAVDVRSWVGPRS